MAGNTKRTRMSANVRGTLTLGKAKVVSVNDTLFPITLVPHMHLDKFYRKIADGTTWLALMVRLKFGVELDNNFHGTGTVSVLIDAFRTMYMIEDRFTRLNKWEANYVEIADIHLGIEYVDMLQSISPITDLKPAFIKAREEMTKYTYYL